MDSFPAEKNFSHAFPGFVHPVGDLEDLATQALESSVP